MKQPVQTPADQQDARAVAWQGGTSQHSLVFSNDRAAAAAQRQLTSMTERSPMLAVQCAVNEQTRLSPRMSVQRRLMAQASGIAGGVAINDDCGLEREADAMGMQALQKKARGPSPYASWVENHSHSYGLTRDGIIQGVFDARTITDDIVSGATGIWPAGGSTGEAYIISTTGEHRQIFIKFTTSDFAVEGARLARMFDVATPQAIPINKADILAKIREVDGPIGALLAKKPYAIAFEFVDGQKVRPDSQARFNAESYREIGAIAAFDMLIGKTDLFDNFNVLEGYEQQNYSNVMIVGAHLVDVDLSASELTPERLQIAKEIIADPGNVHPFVKNKIGELFEFSSNSIALLGIQRSILQTLGRVTPDLATDIANPHVKKTIAIFAKLAEGARDAVARVDDAIADIELREENRRARLRSEAEEKKRAPQKKEVEVAPSGCSCYLTTACCNYYGLADDCEYLTVLRTFRDAWLLKQTNGAGVVQVYYKKAPKLVEAISRRLDEDEIYALILKGIIIAVDLIKRNEMAKAAAFYQTMSISLEKAFSGVDRLQS